MVRATIPTAASILICADKTVHWYDPTNGEVCDPLDCGGGRAPVKYDVPCCAAYTGTEPCVSTTSTLSCWAPSSVSASSTVAASSSAETTAATVSNSTGTSSTGVAAKTSSQETSDSTSAPSTTEAPTQATSSGSLETGSGTESGSAQSISTNAAESRVGPLMAVAGAAIGAVILV
ncbi:unnamed protein product [Penicillium bialowiezense]